jgi:hypothetical protein
MRTPSHSLSATRQIEKLRMREPKGASASLGTDEGDMHAWRMMSNDAGDERDDVVQPDASYAKAAVSSIEKAVEYADKLRTESLQQELEDRKMVKCNHMVPLLIVLHIGEATEHFRLSTVASIQFSYLQAAVAERMGSRWPSSAMLRLTWLRYDGVAVELSATSWREYIFTMWCTQPWVLHAHDASAGESAMPLRETARLLFNMYDINRNGVIELPEFSRALVALPLPPPSCHRYTVVSDAPVVSDFRLLLSSQGC